MKKYAKGLLASALALGIAAAGTLGDSALALGAIAAEEAAGEGALTEETSKEEI